VLGRTLADGGSPVVLAERARPAGRAGAGVELAVGVGVTGVPRAALADGGPANENAG